MFIEPVAEQIYAKDMESRLSWNLENKNKQRDKKFLDYCVLNYIYIFIMWYM